MTALSHARWQTLEPLIDAALALPSEQRAAFVERSCGGDLAMREELTAMLVACERLVEDGRWLSLPAAKRFASLWEEPNEHERFAEALAGRYVLEGEAGRGGMAVVYRAHDVTRDRRVALKVLRTTVAGRGPARFRREIALAAALRHPHIVSVLDSDESAGRLWYTMPFVDGETLGARLRRIEQLEISEVVRLMREIADALGYAHARGVVHRDLKPDNILLSDGRAIIADFGVAKALLASSGDDGPVDERDTTAGVRLGTPLYMAPEQIAGRSADHRIDLYALGVVAYQLITGVTPFDGSSRQAIAAAHLSRRPPSIDTHRAGVPKRLDRLVMRLLEKRSDDRPASASDVGAELAAIAQSLFDVSQSGLRPELSGAPMTDTTGGIRRDDKAAYDAAPPFTKIADRYRVDQRIAAGGMATVFLGEDLKHGRKVAIKVLHPTLAHTIGIQRFLREIEVIARLQHPHLLTLIDSGDVDGLPYYVMPYVEALSLRETIAAQTQMSFDDAIRITREVADGLAYAHQNGVVHRDIKPSNILMSGGHAMVADFGIATALQRAGFQRITETGISLGSPTYMSPEQAAGERDVDSRSDIYSLACVLYEMLAGQPPIDHVSMQQVVTRKLTDGYTKLSELRPDVPPALEAAIHRALSADRHARFATMEEFSQAIAESAPAPAPASRWMLWAAAAAGMVAILAGGTWLGHERAIVKATQRVAEVNSLASLGKFDSAFRVTEAILPIIPHDSALRRLRPAVTDFLNIVTVPAGARVSISRLEHGDSAWRFVGETPIDSLALPRFLGTGVDYKLRVERAGFERVELLANTLVNVWAGDSLVVPAVIDTIRLDSAGAMRGMVRIPGFSLDTNRYRFADYHVSKTEVTNREYARFIEAGGYQKRDYWTEPMERDGRAVAWEAAMAEFRDRSGAPGPSTWNGGTYPPGQDDFPVGGVSYYEAAAYARFAGARLPTYEHWRRAALRNYREFGWTFLATSNINSAQPRRVGAGTINAFGLHDVAGNVREWCVNPMNGGRVAMGGGWEDAEYLVGNLLSRPAFERAPSNGLRLTAFVDAETTLARASRPVSRPARRDYRNFKAVSDAEFAIYRRMFDYDHRPLQPKIELDSVGSRFRWQRVSFTAAYGGERMSAYVFLPKNATPPFEPVIFWPPGSPTLRMSRSPALVENLVGFIPQSRRALVVPVFKGNFERDSTRYASIRDWNPDTTMLYRDFAVQWVKDMRRTIDYLESRNDMKVDGLGFYGVSWGGLMAPMALATEPRIKAAVLNAGGYYIERSQRPEVDHGNYAPRVHAPTLLLSGEHDNTLFPYEPSQLPFFQQLGTPARDKGWKKYSAAGHFVPQEDVVRETLAWFDKYLSGR